jgi:hypothetical protein
MVAAAGAPDSTPRGPVIDVFINYDGGRCRSSRQHPQALRAPQHPARVTGRHTSIGKTELPLRNTKIQSSKKAAREKRCWPHPWVHCLSHGGPGGHCRYPADQLPPRTSSRSRQKARHANHTLPHVHNLSMNHTARGSSGAAACPAAPAPAAQPGAALGPPRVLRLRLPLPSPGQLRGRHVCLEGPTVYVLLK